MVAQKFNWFISVIHIKKHRSIPGFSSDGGLSVYASADTDENNLPFGTPLRLYEQHKTYLANVYQHTCHSETTDT